MQACKRLTEADICTTMYQDVMSKLHKHLLLHLLHMHHCAGHLISSQVANPDEPTNPILPSRTIHHHQNKPSLLGLCLYAADLHQSEAATHKPLQSLLCQQFNFCLSKTQLQRILELISSSCATPNLSQHCPQSVTQLPCQHPQLWAEL